MKDIGCTAIGILRAKPEKRAELFEILRGFVAPTRQEEGCIGYHLHTSDDDPNLFMFYENWRSRQDLEEHLAMPHLAVLRERGHELLAAEVEVKFYTLQSSTNGREPEPMTQGFLDGHQRLTIEAAMARIIPADDQPGAREVGTIDFLDRYLSGLDFIYAKPDGSGFEKLEGKSAEAWQKRIEILRAKYVEGVAELDRRAQAEFGQDFVALAPEQQDRILTALERAEPVADTVPTTGPGYALNTAPGAATAEPALQQTSTETELDFLPLLVVHTRQGFYADPIYGGNKDQVGWRVIGFPGPSSMNEVFTGRYSTLAWFAEGHQDANSEDSRHDA
jgi:gluconate 2-dehydrogenase gamma chain